MQDVEEMQKIYVHGSQFWGTLICSGQIRESSWFILRMPKDSPSIRGTTPQIEQAARQLRQNLTPAETLLWNALRCRQQFGLKFRCQHPVGRFIVDFYCPSCKLVVEVDGDIHLAQEDYDEARTEQLRSFGYRVLRFTNKEVLNDLPTVLACIVEVAKAQFPPELGG